jgi:peptidoglycan/LPS O-acetylase OafA/YrhL
MDDAMYNIKLYNSYRGFLAILVFISHLAATFLYPYFGASGFMPDLFNFLSTWSVNIFFILSGYLITYSILGNISRNGFFKWSDFLISRIARIYPPFIASILLSVLLYWIIFYFNLHGKYSFRLASDLFVIREIFSLAYREILEGLLMRGGLLMVNGALWSLYVEVKIYVVVMLVAILIKGRVGWLAKLISAIALYYVGRQLLSSSVFVMIWGLGGVFSVMHYRKIAWPGSYANGLFILTFAVSLYYAFTPDVFMQNNNTLNGFIATVALSLLLTGIIFVWQTGMGFLHLFHSAADYSYTLYVVHFPLLLFAFSLTHEAISENFRVEKLLAVCVLVFVIIVYAAYWIARYFEDKRRFEGYIRGLWNKDGVGITLNKRLKNG